ncbi:copper amine oxidase N-terminal domain-containing protein [Paenibacillus sp. NPDC056579]|uniref:copper amine oxidase N-terminal domain-containing protein n=1 Tax=Paenibacillus sp. NPDC056579 TaxID=3345871 RepID=UPI0036D08E43
MRLNVSLRQCFLVFLLALYLNNPQAFAESDASAITVTLHGERLIFEQKPVLLDGVTLVPFRTLFENLGYLVSWDEAAQRISAQRGGSKISLVIGSTVASANYITYFLDEAPLIINGNSLVPLRFVAEASGATVSWDQDKYQVMISTDTAESAELKIQRVVESYAFSKSAHDFVEAITRSSGTKNNGYQLDKITVDDKGKEAIVEFTLDFWVSHPTLINEQAVNGDLDMDVSVKVKQKIISDEYDNWVLSPVIRDKEYVVVPMAMK